MLTFYLVRHGIKEPIPFDPPLTEVGQKQAEATAKYLKQHLFKAIVASPKRRTVQTAKIIAKEIGLPVTTDERLEERIEWEIHESFDDFIKEWNKTDFDRSYQPTHGHASKEKGRQMKDVITKLSATYEDGNILIVTHGGSIGDLLRNLFGEENITHQTDTYSGAKFIKVDESSITIIEKRDDGYQLVAIGSVDHLHSQLT